MGDLAISTEGLTKRYRGDVLAVDGVNLRVAPGEIYAFLGLNGAGKSTTIRMLLGMIKPTAGRAEMFGVRVAPGAHDLWRRVGHLVESATAYPELTVLENLDVARQLAGIERPPEGRSDHRRAWRSAHTQVGEQARSRLAICSVWPSPALCSMGPNS